MPLRAIHVVTYGKIWLFLWLNNILLYIYTTISFLSCLKKLFYNCTWHTVPHQFQVYNIMTRHLYNLWSDHLDKSSSHLIPHISITILLTILPMLYSIFPCLLLQLAFCMSQFLFLPHSSLQLPSHLTTISSLYQWVCFCFVCSLFCSSDSTYKCNHMAFVFLCLTVSLSIILSRSIHVVTNGKTSFFF